MTTIDSLLTKIINHNFSDAERLMPHRDARVLRNLAKLIHDPQYITANQAHLLVKLLKEHQGKFGNLGEEATVAIDNPVWSRNFRVISNVRKIYITSDLDYDQIVIETSFSSEIRRILNQLSKVVSWIGQANAGKKFFVELTEKNIVTVIEFLTPYNFEVSEDLKNYYNIIKSWSKNEIVDQYRITTLPFPNFEKQIINDLSIDSSIDQNIINDRSVRYRYFVENTEKNPKNLTEIIAARDQTKVWLNKANYTLIEVFNSFKNLRRLPTLVIFDTRDSKKCLENLKNLASSLDDNGITSEIGIYFRLDNDAAGKEFNQMIAHKHYNCPLDQNTKIVGVQNGKIPKFLLKSSWKPMSVISLDHALRHSKTAVYANCCDLILTYTDSEPIIEMRLPWE